jgi:hypothetical protein
MRVRAAREIMTITLRLLTPRYVLGRWRAVVVVAQIDTIATIIRTIGLMERRRKGDVSHRIEGMMVMPWVACYLVVSRDGKA